MLSNDARRVLIAASIHDEPISFAEIENVIGISQDRLLSALDELQTLFLFPKPRVVEGEQRFELNSNTRKLVCLVEESSDQYARIETAIKAIAGTLPSTGRGIVSALIRQAFLLMNAQRYPEAETLLIKAAEKYPHAADLQGFIGFFYRRRDRFTDATRHFEAAYKLNCKHRDTYRHWVKMEMSLKEWTRAIAAADKALKVIPNFYEMKALKAECKVRSGIDFAQRLQSEKAFRLWRECIDELVVTIKPPEKLESGEREINASMYRTIVICLDRLNDFKLLKHYFLTWQREHPDDLSASRQLEIIENKYSKTLDDLAVQKPKFIKRSHARAY